MKIALAHDSLTQLGGAERVVDAFHELFPQAPVFTLVLDSKLKERYKTWDIRTSWLQIFYNIIPKFGSISSLKLHFLYFYFIPFCLTL